MPTNPKSLILPLFGHTSNDAHFRKIYIRILSLTKNHAKIPGDLYMYINLGHFKYIVNGPSGMLTLPWSNDGKNAKDINYFIDEYVQIITFTVEGSDVELIKVYRT